MRLMSGWTICDRCGFKYRRHQVRRESTNFFVCNSCHDGAYDLKRHPQNRPPPHRRELLPIPDGRPDVRIPQFIFGLEQGGFLLTEAGEVIEISNPEWNINRSVYIIV
jgi:hypothetical protein